jgi:hypothetical protein
VLGAALAATGGYIRKGPGAYITTCFPAQF